MGESPRLVAAVNGKHELTSPEDAYGLHSRIHASRPTVLELIRRCAQEGLALRLAWRDQESESASNDTTEFPTGVLPAVSSRSWSGQCAADPR